MSERQVLSLETLGEVDNGVIVAAFDKALRQVFLDLDDRPDLKTARTLTLTLKMKPLNDKSQLIRADVEFDVKVAIPSKKSVAYPMLPTNDGLEFQPDIPDNPRQRSLGVKNRKDGDE